ncbi:hypothetical protein AMS68_004287 [Peltaster fructicola]|uniref:RRM domain-containing protein n=1 Tax=Peltaster fructicola TaxID=286661 RepID=A0A6H0XWE9_9PEZI|nr:hypothetical protein AMS68_004287 [Peltaster fructicola]
MAYPGYGYAGDQANPYGQQQQQQHHPQYQNNVPYIQNPFAGGATNPFANIDPEHEAQVAQWSSAYTYNPDKDKKRGAPGADGQRGYDVVGVKGQEKQMTVVRKGGGGQWEDNSLLDWDPAHFRIMVGNLAGEVTDDSLFKAFSLYGPSKARVIRDKRTTKSRGYGFVSFSDGDLGFKAAREMVGKYIGSHPVTIERSKSDIRPVQHKDKDRYKKNHKNKSKDKKKEEQDDPLRAKTGAGVEKKKPVRSAGGLKIIG